MTLDQIGLIAGFVCTLLIFSYLLGDNFLYRLAIYAFAGITAGYVTVVTVESVILPWIRGTFGSGDPIGLVVGAVPLVLGVLLLLKSVNRYQRAGNIALAVLIGVGAAVGLVGAISGTLLPVMRDTVETLRPGDNAESNIALVNGFIIIGGVMCTLVYFGRIARRGPDGAPQRPRLFGRFISTLGQGFVVIALGALYGGAILTGLTILSERLAFIFLTIGGG
ncbi:MAG: hypothetical protein KME04_19860 [Pleurocapsa minor GSE-CHR-MK-17-07R]|jgi:hypothetical protein|nr:hypothetical protein [Pleurocapsa minor GSE-CHR-MK 17-07R]